MLRILNKHFTILVVILSCLISVLAVGHWFIGNNILYFWDSYVPLDPKISFNQLFYFWQDKLFPGFALPQWSWFLYWGLFFLPSLFIQSLSIGEFFVYILLLSFSVINFYLLTVYVLKIIFKETNRELLVNAVGLLAAILYTFNIFTFFNFYFMFNPGAFLLAFLPLNILALIHIYPLDGIEAVKKKNMWLFIFFLSLVCFSPAFIVYVFFLQYLVWIAVYLFLFWFTSRKKILSRKTLEIAVFYVLILLANLWWFFPALIGFKESYAGQSSFGTTVWFDQGLESIKLLNSFRLLGTALMVNNNFSWTPLYLENPIFTFPLFIFPFILIVSLIFLIKRKTSNLLTFFLG